MVKPRTVEVAIAGPGAGKDQRNVEVAVRRVQVDIGYALEDVYRKAGLVPAPVRKTVLMCKLCDQEFAAHTKANAGLYACPAGGGLAAAGVDLIERSA